MISRDDIDDKRLYSLECAFKDTINANPEVTSAEVVVALIGGIIGTINFTACRDCRKLQAKTVVAYLKQRIKERVRKDGDSCGSGSVH